MQKKDAEKRCRKTMQKNHPQNSTKLKNTSENRRKTDQKPDSTKLPNFELRAGGCTVHCAPRARCTWFQNFMSRPIKSPNTLMPDLPDQRYYNRAWRRFCKIFSPLTHLQLQYPNPDAAGTVRGT